MSMISAQIDELRQMADGQATYRDARAVMLQAADTITELRDDLQRANAAVQDSEHDESMAWDRVRKAESENAKLRELVAYMWTYDYAGHFSTLPEHMEHVDAVWQQMQLLGIEVGG